MTERCFFIELSEIITGKEMKGAKCTKKAGEAPKQTVDFEEMAAAGGSLDLDENFYGDQDFDMEDFDKEGFGGLDEAGNSLRRREILNQYIPSIRFTSRHVITRNTHGCYSIFRSNQRNPCLLFLTRMHTLIVLIGPTGVGKTELSLRLAETFPYLYRLGRFETTLCRFKDRHGCPYTGATATGTASLRRYPAADRLLQCRPIRSGSDEAAGRPVYKA